MSTGSSGVVASASTPDRHEHSSHLDLSIAAIVCGFNIGFGWFTVLNAVRQTHRLTIYTFLVWTEIVANFCAAILSFLFLTGQIPHSPIFFVAIMVLWVAQVHAILQIIVSRTCLLLPNIRDRRLLRWGTFSIIVAINVVVINLWIPAQMGIEEYKTPNLWFDHAEKIIFLFLDVALNFYFIRAVKTTLMSLGNPKYEKLVQFNQRIMLVSILCDLFIIAMMSYPNPSVYFQMHPLSYCVKLNIELSMSEFIVAVSGATRDSSPPEVKFLTSREDPNIRVKCVTNVDVHHETAVPTFPQLSGSAGRYSAFSPRHGPHHAARAHVQLPLRTLTYPPRQASGRGETPPETSPGEKDVSKLERDWTDEKENATPIIEYQGGQDFAGKLSQDETV